MSRIVKKIRKVLVNSIIDEAEFSHIHHVSDEYLDDFYNTYAPVFVLNTGRSGSAFIQNIFNHFSSIDAHHEASPNLFLLPSFAFHNQDNTEVLKLVFEAARTELILTSKVSNKVYLESNQCLVFFISQIKSIFPNAKFVHLTRHPGDFVTSAIKKGWHKNDSVWEKGRIRIENDDIWGAMNQIEKLSWVWNETHKFIEKFKEDNASNFYTVRFEDLVQSPEAFVKLLDFVGIENQLSNTELQEILSNKVNEVSVSKNEPSNMFKLNSYPKYKDWNETDKSILKQYVNELSQKYGYQL